MTPINREFTRLSCHTLRRIMFDSTTINLLKNPCQDLCQEKHFNGIYYVYENNYRSRIDLFHAAIQHDLLEILLLIKDNDHIHNILSSVIKYDRLDAYILLNQRIEFCLSSVLELVVKYTSSQIASWLIRCEHNNNLDITKYILDKGNNDMLKYLYGNFMNVDKFLLLRFYQGRADIIYSN